MVMHSQVGVWGKRNFGSSQFVLTVKLNQMAENNLFELDGRRDAPSFYVLLSRQGFR